MKNKIKTLGLLLISALTLAGCEDDNNTTYDSDKKTEWSETEKKILSDYYYGVDLPYMYFESEGSLVFDTEQGYASKSAPTVTKDLLDAYGAMFDDSWTDYSCLGADSEGEEHYYYSFEKKVQTENGVRYVLVDFWAETYDSTEKDYVEDTTGNGRFAMDVYDPYYYEWPGDFLGEFMDYYGFESTVPALNGAELYSISYYTYFDIFALVTEEQYNAYVSTLANAGYAFDHYDETYEMDVYTSPAKDIYLSVGYYEYEGDTCIEIVIEEYYEVFDEWPTDFVNDCLKVFNVESTVPAYNDADEYETDDEYLYDSDYGEFGIYCYTDNSDALTTYVSALTAAGYTKTGTDSYGYDSYETEKGDIIIWVCFFEENGCLAIYVDEAAESGGGSSSGKVELNLAGDAVVPSTFGFTSETGNSYLTYSGTTECGATYSGVLSANVAIQINKKSSKGIGLIGHKENAYCEAIGFAFNSKSNGTKIDVYGSNEEFTTADMYNGNVTKIGTATNNGGSAILEIEEEYSYIGFISNSGAIILDKIVFSWIDNEPQVQPGEGQTGEGQTGEGQTGEGVQD